MDKDLYRAVPILMYHQLTPHPVAGFEKYSVTPDAFSKQMSWLARRGYETIPLDALLEFQCGHRNLPARAVLITFDDGFKDAFCYGFPILQTFGFTAVFFLVAGLMEKMSQWLLAERGLELPLMDWGDARELTLNGFQCGAHSMTHPRLANLSPEACYDELRRSKLLLEDQLNRDVSHLAYPFGSYNKQVQSITRELGYRSACTVEMGLVRSGDDLLALRRVPVNGKDSQLDFIFKVRTALGFKDWLRSLLWKKSNASQ